MHREKGENATAKYYKSDIDIYVKLYEATKELPIDQNIVDRVLYAQFLAIALRCIKTTNLTEKEKSIQLSYILKKPYVKKILRNTKTTSGERVTSLIVSTGNISLYKMWKRLLLFLNK